LLEERLLATTSTDPCKPNNAGWMKKNMCAKQRVRGKCYSMMKQAIYIYREREREREDCLSGLVVRVPGCRSRGLGSIPSATIFSEK
jgi:hypothetical protein